MIRPSFWAAFEERPDAIVSDMSAKTQTRAREEPDQRAAHSSDPTRTLTATREEDDQDPGLHGLASIPRAAGSQTQTNTKTREEQDQDPVRSGLAAVQRVTSMSTKTVTEVGREEPDQNESAHRLAAIPRAGEIHG